MKTKRHNYTCCVLHEGPTTPVEAMMANYRVETKKPGTGIKFHPGVKCGKPNCILRAHARVERNITGYLRQDYLDLTNDVKFNF